MANVIIVGDGPAGLSAALFLAKNGQEVTVLGQDKTSMHYAMLYNYLGITEILGSDFMEIARKQVQGFGATLEDESATGIEKTDEGFTVFTESGATYQGKYVIIAEGKRLALSKSLGLSTSEKGVDVGSHFRSSIENLYVVGRSVGIQRSQAIISAGNGATAALDILSIEKGKEFNDFDTPPKS